MRLLAELTFASLLFPISGFAQVPTDAPNDRRIIIDVAVTDKSGKPVSGLQQKDFTLIDNKLPAQITAFEAVEEATADPSPEIILVVDEVNAPLATVAYELNQIKIFLRGNNGHLALPVSMIFFSDSGTKTLDATRDGNALVAAVDQTAVGLRTSGRAQGVYGASDRQMMSVSTLISIAAAAGKRPGRKMIIWLSPGWAYLSGPGIELSNKNQQAIFKSVVAASSVLWQGRIALYSIDPRGAAEAGALITGYYKEFLKPVLGPGQTQAGDLALPVIAAHSGGRVLSADNDIAAMIANCVDDAKARYILAFNAPPADGPNEYHALTVKVDRPGLTARTHAGYYDQP